MMERVIGMRQKRAGLIHDARAMLDKAEKEKRTFTAEEEEQYQRMDGDIDKLETDANRLEKQIQRERALGESGAPPAGGDSDQDESEGQRTLSDVLQDRSVGNIQATEEYRTTFSEWLRDGASSLTAEEYRAMQADSDAGGGYLIAPQEMVMNLLKEVDNTAVIRQFATVHQLTTAKSLGVPTLKKNTDDADWTAELKTGELTELEFGKRELRPHPLAKRALISNTLLRMAQIGPEALLREKLAYMFAVTQEKAFMSGDGNQKPLGVFVDSANGISSDRDMADGNTAAKITPDNLINCKYHLKEAYLTRARWIFHREVLREIRKIKDGNGQYIWQAGITGGAPDRILELPYTTSEYAPKTFGANNYVGILGDFRYYWIVEALNVQIQRLVELYAETNQTAFIARYEGDGMPMMEEAFVRVKLGA